MKKNDAADPRVEFYRNTSLPVRRKDNPFRIATPTFTSCSFKYRREILASLALAGVFPQTFHFAVDRRPPITGSVTLNVRIVMLCVCSFLCYNETRTRSVKLCKQLWHILRHNFEQVPLESKSITNISKYFLSKKSQELLVAGNNFFFFFNFPNGFLSHNRSKYTLSEHQYRNISLFGEKGSNTSDYLVISSCRKDSSNNSWAELSLRNTRNANMIMLLANIRCDWSVGKTNWNVYADEERRKSKTLV